MADKEPEKAGGEDKSVGARTPFDTLRTEIDRVFDDVTRSWPPLGNIWSSGRRAVSALRSVDIVPHVDSSEDDKAYEIAIELPGVDEKDVTLSIDSGTLTVRGEKKSEREEKKKEFHLTERSYGMFERSFGIPDNVDEAAITADFDKGVLTVTLPKSATAKASERRIPIGGGKKGAKKQV